MPLMGTNGVVEAEEGREGNGRLGGGAPAGNGVHYISLFIEIYICQYIIN